MFLGAKIPPGEHEIMFKYSPPGFKEGLLLSAFGILLMAGLRLFLQRRILKNS